MDCEIKSLSYRIRGKSVNVMDETYINEYLSNEGQKTQAERHNSKVIQQAAQKW